MSYPPLRYVEATQIEHEGQPIALIRDPEGLCGEALAVPLPLFLIMTLLDGRRGAKDLQYLLAKATGGQIITQEELDRIVEQLDRFYLLENERVAARRASLEREFAELPARPAFHAGGAYPAEPEPCRQMFDQFFAGLTSLDGNGPHPRGLVLPHIDLRVGGRCLAEGLARLDPLEPPRLYIILGVAHHPARNLFTLTDKSFETPLGLAQTDRAAAARLRELYGAGRLDGEYIHKSEHSVEFQVVALKYLHREAEFKILPVLCGSLHEELRPDAPSPAQRPEVRDFIDALRRLSEEYAGDVCLIASVDLSHVGLKFGDEQGVDDLRAQGVRRADEEMLALVEAMDAEAFFGHFRADANARNVDAVTAVYVMLRALGRGRAERVGYEQWREAETDSMVTFASLAIY